MNIYISIYGYTSTTLSRNIMFVHLHTKKSCALQMDSWRLYQSSCPNQLRSCQSTVGTATWGCRGFIYQKKPPSLAGCSPSPRATTSTVDSTMSLCKNLCPFSLLLHLDSSLWNLLWNSLFCSHIQYGAPPVINPIGSVFPNETLWSPCLSLILPVISQSSTTFNLSNPAPGDWYVGAHLPEDDGRIEQKVCIRVANFMHFP